MPKRHLEMSYSCSCPKFATRLTIFYPKIYSSVLRGSSCCLMKNSLQRARNNLQISRTLNIKIEHRDYVLNSFLTDYFSFNVRSVV